MNKSLFLPVLLAMIFFTSISFAQNKNDLEFGFFAGVSLASVVVEEESSDLKSKIALNAGFFSEYFFSEKWSLKSKIYYDQRGFDNAQIETIFTGTGYLIERGSYTFHNVTIPVLANFNFGNNERFYLNLGPFASYVFSVNLQMILILLILVLRAELDLSFLFPIKMKNHFFWSIPVKRDF